VVFDPFRESTQPKCIPNSKDASSRIASVEYRINRGSRTLWVDYGQKKVEFFSLIVSMNFH